MTIEADPLACLSAFGRITTIDTAPAQVEKTDATIGDHRLDRKAAKRQMLHLLEVSNAAKAIQRIPEEGESVHAIMKGNFNAWDIVPAMLTLAACPIAALTLTTLGFNRKNTLELMDLLAAGKIQAVDIVCSCYFRDASPNEFKFMAEQITAHSQRIIATRNHSKIMLIAFADGRKITIESSANLRTCNNIEQFCMTNDAALYHFHKGWIEEVFNGKDGAKAKEN